MDYKNSLRIRQTQRPLPDTEISVSEIADISNLNNACYYTVFSNHAQAYRPLNAEEKHTKCKSKYELHLVSHHNSPHIKILIIWQISCKT